LFRQALRYFEPVNAVNPSKILSHLLGFVALNGANAMPLYGQVGQAGHFVNALLNVIFPKRRLPCRKGFTHRLRCLGFGHCQQQNGARLSSNSKACKLNSLADLGQIVRN
jgi:hypothetical protein